MEQRRGAEDPYLDVELSQAPLEEPGVRGEGGGSHLCKHTDTVASAPLTAGTSLLRCCGGSQPPTLPETPLRDP